VIIDQFEILQSCFLSLPLSVNITSQYSENDKDEGREGRIRESERGGNGREENEKEKEEGTEEGVQRKRIRMR
jgi:hypothetical protein